MVCGWYNKDGKYEYLYKNTAHYYIKAIFKD